MQKTRWTDLWLGLLYFMYRIKDQYQGFYQYLSREGYSYKTIAKHEYFARRAIVPALGDMEVETLTLYDLSKIKLEVSENFNGNITYSQRRALISFRRFMRYIQERGIPTRMNWRDIPFPRRPDSDPDSLTQQEIEYMFSKLNINHFPDLRLRVLFEILLKAGLRISEALSLDIENIDFNNEEIQVQNVKSKKFNWIGIPGATALIEMYLHDRKDDHPALFITTSGYGACKRLDMQGAKSALRRFKKRITLRKPLTFHIWRRTFCTMLLERGVDIKSVQFLARHESPSTTMRYYIAVNQKKAKEQHRKAMNATLYKAGDSLSTAA